MNFHGFTGIFSPFYQKASILQRSSVPVGLDASRQYHDALNQAPDADGPDQKRSDADAGKNQSHNREHKLKHGLGSIAQIKVVHTESPQENAQKSRGNLGLGVWAGNRRCACLLYTSPSASG